MSEQPIINADTVNAVTDKIGAAFTAVSDKMAELAHTYGSDVVDATLAIVRINAAQQLVYGFLALVMFLLALWGFLALCKEAQKPNSDIDSVVPGFIVTTPVGLISLWVALAKLVSVWNWVGVFQPKLALAKQLLDKVIN